MPTLVLNSKVFLAGKPYRIGADSLSSCGGSCDGKIRLMGNVTEWIANVVNANKEIGDE
jgi:hypothetical protein